MIVPINNNFSPLPFYDVSDAGVSEELKNKYLNSEKPYAYGAVFDLAVASGWLMPFQFSVDYEVDHIGGCYVIPLTNPALNTQVLSNIPTIVYDTTTGKSSILFVGEHRPTLVLGRAYIEVELFDTDGNIHVYMSDLFTNIQESSSNIKSVPPDGYIRLSYTNNHYLRYNGGKIYFGEVEKIMFGFELLIDTTICKPNYTFEEKSSDRLGYRYIESQVSNKGYQFTFVAPEYLCDALRLLPMCNDRTIVDKLHTYDKITDVNVEVEWLDQGDLARVTISFNHDTVVANLAEYVSVAPAKLNTSLPVPPTPEVTLPRVVINSIIDLQQTEATLESEVVSDGNGTLTERGLCWSATGTPTISDLHLPDAQHTLGQYTTRIQNLTAGRTYYCRAYAINEAGIAYSNMVTLETLPKDEPPQVLTYPANNVTDVDADISGSVISEGTQPVTSRGFVISSTNSSPQIGGNDVSVYINSGTGLGSFIQSFNNLQPATTYYYAAFAISRVATVYGAIMSFTTKGSMVELPTVITDTVPRNITHSGATLGGTVVTNGGGHISERGICLVAGENEPTINDIRIADSVANLGTYFVDATGLVANTNYLYRAYAINEAGVGYGETGKFVTDSVAAIPTVTFDQYNPQTNSIRLDAHVVSDNGSPIVQNGMGFRYSLSQDMANSTSIVAGQVSGYSFGDSITGLTPDTTYYCQAWATNSVGTGYSSIVAITTKEVKPIPPTVIIDPVNDEIDYSAAYKYVDFDCEVTDGGTHPVTERGVCWSDSANNPTIANNHQAAQTGGVGQYTVSVRQTNFVISDKITYFYRAYAISAAGTAYSVVRSCRFHYASSGQEEDEESERQD
jgi:hypothetical protein